MLVYPVPVKGAYVLGVHSTITVDGRVKVGPTVFPTFAQENYDYLQGLTPQQITKNLCAYSNVFRSPTERGLIWHFLKNELYKSLSINELVKDVNEI